MQRPLSPEHTDLPFTRESVSELHPVWNWRATVGFAIRNAAGP
jgi:hypothetical protein